MNLNLTVSLIISRHSSRIKLFMFGGLLFLSISLFSLFWKENNLKLFFFIAGLLFLWVGTLFKDYSKIGTIKWYVDKIVIDEENGTTTYDIQETRNIEESQVSSLRAIFDEWKCNGIDFSINNATYRRFYA